MLASANTDHRVRDGNVGAVVVDELRAFARDDRGYHLLAVLERVQRMAGGRSKRVGLSATIGMPDDLLVWVGGGISPAQAGVVARDVPVWKPRQLQSM